MRIRKPLTPEQKEARRIYKKEWKRRQQQMFPEKIQEEAAYKKEWKRRQREMFPDKIREDAAKWRAENLERARALRRKSYANRSDETKERDLIYSRVKAARYSREDWERILGTQRARRAQDPERWREIDRKRYARLRLRREPKVGSSPLAKSATEAKSMLLLQNAAYARAIKYVPRHLPQDMRDDLISDIVVACLEGKVRVEDVKKSVPRFVAAHNRAAGYNVSLDAEIGDGMRLIDIITEENLPW